ncbi:MAG: hypothetical protein MUC87_18325 [Bacteroidia bacterium]|jgi:hypothetical protein|nr:hypothetical protein [Bacteroidia bacterium]
MYSNFGKYDLGRITKKVKRPVKKQYEEPEEEEEQDETPKAPKKKKAAQVEMIDEQIKLLKRFKPMIGKTVPLTRLLNFIKALQRAIHLRKVRKTDRYADELETVQRFALKAYNGASENTVKVKAPADLVERLKTISTSQKVRASVKFLQAFVNVSGIPYREVSTRIKTLLERLDFYTERGLIKPTDPYYSNVQKAANILRKAIDERTPVFVPQVQLNGLAGIVSYSKQSKKKKSLKHNSKKKELGFIPSPEVRNTQVMTAKQMAEMEFETLPFTGYYKRLLGNPEHNFWLMIYGAPFQGKTTFSINFAKYLAENIGKVLYISSEQYRSESLKQVIQRVNAQGINLIHFTPSLDKAPDLAHYDFVFFDSANAANLRVNEIMQLREQYPGTAFITILQSVKSGDFHGKQEWRHIPDIVLKIENGKLQTEKNRYFTGLRPELMPLPPLD